MAKAAYPTIGIAAFVMFGTVYFIGCLLYMAKAAYPTIGIAAFVMFGTVYFIGCLPLSDAYGNHRHLCIVLRQTFDSLKCFSLYFAIIKFHFPQ